MTQIPYSALREHPFNMALKKLVDYPRFKPTLALSIARLVKRIDEERSVAQDLYIKILKQHAELDALGELVPKDGKPNTYIIKADSTQEALDKALEEFGKETFSVEMKKFPLDLLEGVGLSGSEIMSLESLLEGEDDGKTVKPPLQAVPPPQPEVNH